MVSPIFNVTTDPQWRDHAKATWQNLTRNYEISGNDACSTHIHVSLQPDYCLTDLKQIASSVIYFELAIEALVPEYRRGDEDGGNEYAKSNWLNSSELAKRGKTRSESIDEILGASSI